MMIGGRQVAADVDQDLLRETNRDFELVGRAWLGLQRFFFVVVLFVFEEL